MHNSNALTKKVCLSLIVCASLTMFSCASRKNQSNDTQTEYYQAAQTYLENENYTMAITRLNELQNLFPFGHYAQAGLLDLMYAYYQSGQYEQALAEADRFTRLKSDHPQIDYAWFIRSMSYYKLFLANQGPLKLANPASRSMEFGTQAFAALQQYLALYPQSQYREDAIKAQITLKDLLAQNELLIAHYYIKRNAWLAAQNRAKNILDHYSGVSVTEEALVILIEAYDQLGLIEQRNNRIEQLKQDYPTHQTLATGQYSSPQWNKDRWWLKLITLGIHS